ncbi:MAG TPA: hypothetical protein VNJ08_10590 [Bacteriovoracaceae bacterium]|nr:hypothetical protein [Bacteriovoracaceae bacterium]
MKQRPIPIDLIRFVAKTGFITKDMWKNFFHADTSRVTTFRYWRDLVARGYFSPHPNPHLKDVLVLNRKNLHLIGDVQRLVAYAPNPILLEHDEFLLTGLLKLIRGGIINEWQTEAQLRILDPKELRLVAKGERLKFPDALVRLSIGSVALEYERTQKSKKRYREILNAYSDMENIKAVIWIVKDEWISGAIKNEIKASYYPLNKRPIGFLMEKTWKEAPEKLIELETHLKQSFRLDG